MMRSLADRGRVYRRCGCRDTRHRQLGAHCPTLATNPDHGTWTFAVDLPSSAGKRATIRRGGFTSEDGARTALRQTLEDEAAGFNADPNQTVADYLTSWLDTKVLCLKPTTAVRFPLEWVMTGWHGQLITEREVCGRSPGRPEMPTCSA